MDYDLPGGLLSVKIAIFTDSYKPYVSGVVRSIDTFSTELLNLGHDVYIFAPRYYQNVNDRPQATTTGAGDSETPRVFRFWSIPVPGYPGFAAPIPVSLRAEKLIRDLGIQVMHTHGPFALGGLGAVLARKQNLPLVFTHHTMYHEYVHYLPGARSFSKGKELWSRFVLSYVGNYSRKVDLVIAPTPQIRSFIIDTYGIDHNKVIAIPTGIPMEQYRQGDPTWLRAQLGIPETDSILLFVGRLGEEKNIPFLLEALGIILKEMPSANLVLVGDGPQRAYLQRQAAQLGLESRVYFTGPLERQRVIDAMHSADLFVIASLTETQGLATLEALASGLPVIGVDAPGTRDLVRDGVDGYLTPHDPQVFAQRVAWLLRNPGHLRKLATNAVSGAAVFSARNMALKLVAAYESLLAVTPRSRS